MAEIEDISPLAPLHNPSAVLGMRVALAYAPSSIGIDLRQPIPVVTNWHGFGALVLGIIVAKPIHSSRLFGWKT